MLESTCPQCGSAMTMSTGPGRLRRYRRQGGFEVPHDLAFPVCGSCGAEWLTDEQVFRMGEAFEAERRKRLASVLLVTAAQQSPVTTEACVRSQRFAVQARGAEWIALRTIASPTARPARPDQQRQAMRASVRTWSVA